MVKIFASEPFYSRYISFASLTISTHLKIVNNYRFWPYYFKDVVGAIDGSHIPTSPPQHDRAVYCNWKGFVSQNCLFACNFGMRFTYVLTGWEGSATDAQIFQDACTSSLEIPAGKYFCQTVNLSNQTLVVSDVSGVQENLFRSSGSPGFPVPNSESHGTTWNRSEATSPKVIPACVRLLHTTPFSRTFYLTTCQT